MIQAEEAIRAARGLIGTAYSELDCINLIKKVIRTCAGGERAGSAEYGRVIVCAGGGLRMRVKPNGRYMQMIPDGTRLAVLEEKDGWLRTAYRGHTGWISGRYCCKAGED